jgi:hypothetical protein
MIYHGGACAWNGWLSWDVAPYDTFSGFSHTTESPVLARVAPTQTPPLLGWELPTCLYVQLLDLGSVPGDHVEVRLQEFTDALGDIWQVPGAIILDTLVPWFGPDPQGQQYRLGARFGTGVQEPVDIHIFTRGARRAKSETGGIHGCEWPNGHPRAVQSAPCDNAPVARQDRQREVLRQQLRIR